MKTSDFSYQLPPELIAQHPAEPRDHSRLLKLDRETGTLEHLHFFDLPEVLRPTDILVRNNTKVIPARLLGHKTTGGEVEVLLLHRLALTGAGEEWECLTKPGLKPDQEVVFSPQLRATCREVRGYSRVLEFSVRGPELMAAFYEVGHTPIPPYIAWNEDDEATLRQKYQTIYAKHEGSAAAPTAGLHFTPELHDQLRQRGVEIEEVTLHVGLGTFLPVKEENVTQHHLHTEEYQLGPGVAARLNTARQAGRRIIAVGTTTCRVLETCCNQQGKFIAGSGQTDIFIYPPYQFRGIDGLITNFHLPQSSLLMLVAAFVTIPNTRQAFSSFAQTAVGKAYQTAIKEKYRFYSFGDAMLIE